MDRRPTANPPSRFADVTLAYDDGEGPPPSAVTLLEDHSRSILSHNDSPDLPFRWSANPYRGCLHACAYCLDGATPILLADGRTRALADVRVGDEIYGTKQAGAYRRYVHTRVLDHWSTIRCAYRIVLSDGSELVASGDHRFLTNRGWKHVIGGEHGERRPHLTSNDQLLGIGRFAAQACETAGYREIAALRTSTHELEQTATERRVVSITRLGPRRLFDITTGTGDFIANGVISHNCYARPTHEYLDLGAGTDFDTKIVVKPRAAELLREAFDKPSWQGELVMFSGVTDCYQAIEAQLHLTRQCLEVCLEYRNPVAVISKSALVERDAALFAELAREAGCHVSVSLAFADDALARRIEPWAASPSRRLKVIETLAKAGVPVGVMCAPVIPGLNDDQLVRVLEGAHAAGARWAGWTLLRLPGPVATIFEERVRAAQPLAADKILHRIRQTRGGERLDDPRFGARGRGEGVYADTIGRLFDATVHRLGLDARDETFQAPSRFRRPPRGQLTLF